MFFLPICYYKYYCKKKTMKILKFGGSSISNAENIKNVCSIISDNTSKIVVFSATKNTTNLLSGLINELHKGNLFISEQILSVIKENHLEIINSLYSSTNFKEIAIKKLNDSISKISGFFKSKLNKKNESTILAQGELLSSMMIYLYLLESNIDAALIPAFNYLKLTSFNEPNYAFIRSQLTREIQQHKDCRLFITQGFIALNHKGETTNFTRGGSDYSATIVGKAIHAESIEIWTDIDGLQNNDPRYVQETSTIESLSYEEASELAFFGAKILHPLTLKPIQDLNIPLRIKNTFNPTSTGTQINHNQKSKNLRAIASKDHITTIKLKSGKMMQAYGFLKRIFEVFEKYQTSVDMLTTSEISVAMTIEHKTFINEIVSELENIGEVQVENNQSIICIVQNYAKNPNLSIQEIISGLDNIPVKMISFGSSDINFSIIVDSANKNQALNLLNNKLLKREPCLIQN